MLLSSPKARLVTFSKICLIIMLSQQLTQDGFYISHEALKRLFGLPAKMLVHSQTLQCMMFTVCKAHACSITELFTTRKNM